jgi:succinate dehydrogenase/fumarate reductase cytochrome b subunit (b558 family)
VQSATGVLPLGAFFALHLWINARATQGRRAYETWVYALQSLPGRPLIEALFIGAPLAFHAVYGVLIVLERVPSYPEPPHVHPWSRSMQRATGVAALLFVLLHLSALRVPLLAGALAPADLHPRLTEDLSRTSALGFPLWATAYLLGLAATSYHLANGLSRFCSRAGFGDTPRARRAISIGCTLAGGALFFLGANTVVYFATGAPLIGSVEPARPSGDATEKRV